MIVDVGSGEKNRIGEIYHQRSGGVVADEHVAAEERAASAGVEKARAAGSGETKNAADDIAGAGGNVGDHRALAAAGGPTGGGTGLGEIALAGVKNYADLMHARANAARGRCGSSAGGCESAGQRDEGEMRSVWDGGDGKRAVVAGDGDSGGGDELSDDQSVRGAGLNCGRGGGGGACAAGGQSGGPGDIRKLRAAGRGDDWESAVVSG